VPVVASAAPPSLYAGGTEALAVLILLTEFAMLRAPLSRSQVRLYAAQSFVASVLAVLVAATQRLPDLYVLACFGFALKVLIIPAIVLRLLQDADQDVATSNRMGVASMVLIAVALSAFALVVVGEIPLPTNDLPTATLGTATAIVLVSFLLVIFRSDVVSQAIGFFSLENGVFVASLVLAARLPFIVEFLFLSDLLVAVVVFGVLMRVHHGRSRTLSTDALDRLRG
jgi:hydrogenase-4 component E